MTIPRDAEARKYYRVAKQRLEEAELVLMKIARPAASIYLTGYAVECILKALLLVSTPARGRRDMMRLLKDDYGHHLGRLWQALGSRGVNPPRDVARALVLASTWSPEMRYEPGIGDPVEAEDFLKAAKAIVAWADGRM